MLIFSTGIRSNISITEDSDIITNRGIVVDSKMATNIKDIYACGDVAEFNGLVYGNWPAAIEMGKIAAINAAGLEREFKNFTPSIILSALNTEMVSIGLINFKDESLESLTLKDKTNENLTKLFFKDNVIVGGIVIGDLSNSGKLIMAIDNNSTKSEAILSLV